jgi:hypothetical protein
MSRHSPLIAAAARAAGAMLALALVAFGGVRAANALPARERSTAHS